MSRRSTTFALRAASSPVPSRRRRAARRGRAGRAHRVGSCSSPSRLPRPPLRRTSSCRGAALLTATATPGVVCSCSGASSAAPGPGLTPAAFCLRARACRSGFDRRSPGRVAPTSRRIRPARAASLRHRLRSAALTPVRARARSRRSADTGPSSLASATGRHGASRGADASAWLRSALPAPAAPRALLCSSPRCSFGVSTRACGRPRRPWRPATGPRHGLASCRARRCRVPWRRLPRSRHGSSVAPPLPLGGDQGCRPRPATARRAPRATSATWPLWRRRLPTGGERTLARGLPTDRRHAAASGPAASAPERARASRLRAATSSCSELLPAGGDRDAAAAANCSRPFGRPAASPARRPPRVRWPVSSEPPAAVAARPPAAALRAAAAPPPPCGLCLLEGQSSAADMAGPVSRRHWPDLTAAASAAHLVRVLCLALFCPYRSVRTR